MDFWYWLTHQFTPEASIAIREWYLALEKPFFAPPAEAFGLAWAIIYTLIALAFLRSLYLYRKGRVSSFFLLLFAGNIALNLSFSPALLATKDNALISLVIILILGTLAWLQIWAYVRVCSVFWMLLPYLLWVTFATVLQLSITVLNRLATGRAI